MLNLGALPDILVLALLRETYLFSDISIFIDIVKVESPVEFFLDGASQEDRKTHNKILQWGDDSWEFTFEVKQNTQLKTSHHTHKYAVSQPSRFLNAGINLRQTMKQKGCWHWKSIIIQIISRLIICAGPLGISVLLNTMDCILANKAFVSV